MEGSEYSSCSLVEDGVAGSAPEKLEATPISRSTSDCKNSACSPDSKCAWEISDQAQVPLFRKPER
jgi:hypothetical protein